jgi:hypothetical protein
MRTIEYHALTREFKLKEWGVGPWVDEPDKVLWQDEKNRLAMYCAP